MSNKSSLVVGLGALTVLFTTPILSSGCKTTSSAKSESTEMPSNNSEHMGDNEGNCGSGSCGSEHDGSCGTEK